MENSKVMKTRRGKVVSRSGDKSIRVMIEYKVKHPLYGKYINRRTKLGVHDPKNVAKVGDLVEITECRPISKTISWRLIQVLEEAVIK
ncbi:30S ribosomal protein S17 [Limihaloglobus sulfuriphilus]|uniref:Small ribosomal subunit protein uS17 n=1 Tax=Limihaloglobus sulfuriphilus TaxID=1851148 RepID=A0A1Q2MIC0_9BACT|nr:30S ribosomal protein S17 [Limihaloglobus sulfuriphilus]AQQ72047.1 30S ribosomal protein S17 [Limihaloglobus sulfuriphilus]